MSFGKARGTTYQNDVMNKLMRDVKFLYSYGRTGLTPSQFSSPVITGTAAPQAKNGSPTFTKTSGDSMQGPFAFGNYLGFGTANNIIEIDGSGRGHFNVGPGYAYTSNTYALPPTGSSVTLNWIDGDIWDGQVLKLHVLSGYTIIIANGDGSTTGNIQLIPPYTSQSSATGNLIIVGPQVVTFIFDSTFSPNGKWIVDAPFDIYEKILVDPIPNNTGVENTMEETFSNHYFTWNINNNASWLNYGYAWYLAGNPVFGIIPDPIAGAPNGILSIYAANFYTSASAGSASALPAAPARYLYIQVEGVDYKIALYNP